MDAKNKTAVAKIPKKKTLAKKKPGLRKFTPAQLEKAIRASNGIISQAARILNCSRELVCIRIKEYPRMLEILEESREAVLDFCEGKVMQHITNDSESMLQYYLNSQGRARGYGKNPEMNVNIAGTIERIIIESVEPKND